MLTFDDSNGQSDIQARDRLDAMIAVGSEFITSADESSTIQRSGQFVHIEMEEQAQSVPRLCFLHESSDCADAQSGAWLTDDELFSHNGGIERRTTLYTGVADGDTGQVKFAVRSGLRLESRLPRFTRIREGNKRYHPRLPDCDYATQAGKRRAFSLGDGRIMVVCEFSDANDSRWYAGIGATGMSARRRRASRVALRVVQPDTGVAGPELLAFDVYSGLGFDPDQPSYRLYSQANPGASLPLYDGARIYAATTGVLWGRILVDGVAGSPSLAGDPSDTYAVAEPAMRRDGASGKTYLALVAVFPAADDVHNPLSAGPYRLTCARTDSNGDVVCSKVALPTLAYPGHYLAVAGVQLLRCSPDNLALIVTVHPMQSGPTQTAAPGTLNMVVLWSLDGGASWSAAPSHPQLAWFPYGSCLVCNATTVLVFTRYSELVGTLDSNKVRVFSVTPDATTQISEIPGHAFNDGLSVPRPGTNPPQYRVPYIGFGYGGAVFVKRQDKVVQRLWMQFDPRWSYGDATGYNVVYPGARPMLMSSDDGGTTWVRRFLPTAWQQCAGFVVAVDPYTLAVPVYEGRRPQDDFQQTPVRVAMHLSKDGGTTWKAAGWSFTLPAYTYVDGLIAPGAYDIVESTMDYNRGELFPAVVLRNAQGDVAPINPSRPWMADHRIKEPVHG